MTTQYIPINPQPSGDGLDSPLDGEWLNKEFNGLCLPKISDLPTEFNEPNPFPDAGVLVGVIRVGGEWLWECQKIIVPCLGGRSHWIEAFNQSMHRHTPGFSYYPPAQYPLTIESLVPAS
jgi:hypothetical protein